MKRIYLFIVTVVLLFACVILAVNPGLADILYDEDNFFESLTVIVCGIGLVLSLAVLVLRIRKRSGYGFWIFMSVLLFIFIGDDVSWGMRYFGFTKHKIAGIGFDGVHDIFSISIGFIKLVRDHILSIGISDIRSIAILAGSAITLTACMIFLIKLIVLKRKNIMMFLSNNLKWRPFAFLFIGFIMLAVSMLIDEDNLIGFPHKAVPEESLELLAATAFLFSCISGVKEIRPSKKRKRNV